MRRKKKKSSEQGKLGKFFHVGSKILYSSRALLYIWTLALLVGFTSVNQAKAYE